MKKKASDSKTLDVSEGSTDSGEADSSSGSGGSLGVSESKDRSSLSVLFQHQGSSGKIPILQELKSFDAEFKRIEREFKNQFLQQGWKNLFQVTRIRKVVNAGRKKEYAAAKKKLREKKVEGTFLKNRWGFCTNPDYEQTKQIALNNINPAECKGCLKGEYCYNPGDFGDHTKGVYLDLHPDPTFSYQKIRIPEKGDEGAILMFRFFSGRYSVCFFSKRGLAPDLNYQSHRNNSGIQYYLFDTNQIMPCYILHWKL